MADIRPMNFGEILDGSLMIYRRHFVLFLKLALVALSVPVVLFVYVGLRAFGDLRALGDLTNALRTLLYLVPVRSEEHTSELQSRLHLVCRLLLEKKKNNVIDDWATSNRRSSLSTYRS